jgi:hypothetical protein
VAVQAGFSSTMPATAFFDGLLHRLFGLTPDPVPPKAR